MMNSHMLPVDKYVTIDRVPSEFYKAVCWSFNAPYIRSDMCHGVADRGSIRVGDRGISFCTLCNRPLWHYLFQCVNCGEFFVKDFASPNFCAHDPHCWNCVSELSGPFCSDIKQHSNNELLAPLGLTPTILSPEKKAEIEAMYSIGDLLDFDF